MNIKFNFGEYPKQLYAMQVRTTYPNDPSKNHDTMHVCSDVWEIETIGSDQAVAVYEFKGHKLLSALHEQQFTESRAQTEEVNRYLADLEKQFQPPPKETL